MRLKTVEPLLLEFHRGLQVLAHPRFRFVDLRAHFLVELIHSFANDFVNLVSPELGFTIAGASPAHQLLLRLRQMVRTPLHRLAYLLEGGHCLSDAIANVGALLLPVLLERLLQAAYLLQALDLFLVRVARLLQSAETFLEGHYHSAVLRWTQRVTLLAQGALRH